MTQASASGNITGVLADYMAEARDRVLPPDVDREAKHRLLDSLAAIVSGSTLLPGQMAAKYVRTLGGVPESMVMTTDIVTSAANAALANGMMGHADETDDFDPPSKAHPGCSVVPAAWAMAEREGASGTAMLRAVALGYDVACRMLLAVDGDKLRAAHHSAEGFGATFGATGAAASLARLDSMQMRYVLSYAAQQASGLWAWVGDEEHVEKAFDFAGMGARNGVTAATMVQLGFSGVPNVLDGEHNLLLAFSHAPDPRHLVEGLGERYSVTSTAIKPYSVGYPIQSALDALFTITAANNLVGGDVESVVRQAAHRRRGRGQQPRHAGRQHPALHCDGVGGRRRFLHLHPLLRAHGRRRGAGHEGARDASARGESRHAGGPATGHHRGDDARRAHAEPPHQVCAGHGPEPPRHGPRLREST